MSITVRLLFQNKAESVQATCFHGTLLEQKKVSENSYTITVEDESLKPGPYATRLTVKTEKNGFSFFLRDVNMVNPIWIQIYGVIITTLEDSRGYDEIVWLASREDGWKTAKPYRQRIYAP